ncbi:MAG: SDR family oxidoreductase [Gammaproteobacteria bacterium]|jgi:UDP-glucose 4-epimerase|nr:SDR family oxidoreductase [Gammaproteobacteria bacterium]
MRVLITGGAGYVGNELVYRLAAARGIDEIVIYDNLVKGNYNLFTGLRKLPQANIRFVRGDILDSRKLRKLMAGMDVVYHLAATVSTANAEQNPHAFEQTNHWGTAELVYAVEESEVQRLVYLSSVAVYGVGASVEDASAPTRPESYYGITKLRGEEHVRRLMEKRRCYVVRAANIYGYSKNLRMDATINRLLFDAHFDGRITLHGAVSHRRPYISIARVVDILHQLASSTLPGGVYNLVDKNQSIADVIDTLRELYPSLEMIFVDQHMPLLDLEVRPDPAMGALHALPERNLAEDLREFREMFTF